MKPDSSALRGFYKEFVDSEAGRDFIQWCANQELSLQLQAYKAETAEQKAALIDRQRGLYEARTHMVEMSKPVRKQSK